ncbi:MAG: DUF305 domain-containing protein [Ilumatobacteraceae bacterium]
MRRLVSSLSLIGALAVGTAACGRSSGHGATTVTPIAAGSPTTMATSNSTGHNDADVTFAEEMISHHQQALTMASMALDGKAGASAAVNALATKIDAAQTPEINTIERWLDEWNVPMSTGPNDSSMRMGMGNSTSNMGGADGMTSDADMRAMAAVTGPAFDKLWLTGMIVHHQGAIAMGTTEKQTGKNVDALKLANSIADSQAVEVTEMQQLLAAG